MATVSAPQPSAQSATAFGTFLSDHERQIQAIKWIIYSLLTINFGLYLFKDIVAAGHTITDQTTLWGWVTAFAVSTDQFAWVMLIFIYELETYWLEDDYSNKLVDGLMTAGKLIFAIMVLNTVIAYSSLALDLKKVTLIDQAGGLCAMADQGYSFIRNLAYTSITAETCGTISHAGDLFLYPKEPVITDAAGLTEDGWHHVLDVVEALAWFMLLGLVELSVRLLDRGTYKGRLTTMEMWLKALCYACLIGVSVFWLAKGHYMYVWDEFLWVASFLLLELNMAAWRAELAHTDANNLSPSMQPDPT